MHVNACEDRRSRSIAGDLYVARVADQDGAWRDVAVDSACCLESMEGLSRRESVVCHDQAELGGEQQRIFLGARANRRQRFATEVFHDEAPVALDFWGRLPCRQMRGMHVDKFFGPRFRGADIDGVLSDRKSVV